MICKTCAHYDSCKSLYSSIKILCDFDTDFYKVNECVNYLEKSQFSKVTKCEDCKYFLKVGDNYICERFSESSYSYCRKTDFCSYGIEKDQYQVKMPEEDK